MEEERHETTVSEAGRKGGQATAARHGREFYEKIGRQGGETVRQMIQRGRERLKEQGKDGG